MKRICILLLVLIIAVGCSKQKTNPQEVKDKVMMQVKAIQASDASAFIETSNIESVKNNCANQSKNKPNAQQATGECVKDIVRMLQSKYDNAINKKLIPYSAKFEIMETKASADDMIKTRVKVSYANKDEAFRTKDGKLCKEAVVDFMYSERGKGMLPVETDYVGVLSEY
ncbi:MAG TPA: hypothetical protein HPP97_04550 [Desulfuromonadales bacterium]|nr:hypothetical protein [Desulfuromonadales bacterium]